MQIKIFYLKIIVLKILHTKIVINTLLNLAGGVFCGYYELVKKKENFEFMRVSDQTKYHQK